MATLESRLNALISAIGPDMKKALAFYVPFGRAGTLATFTGPRIYFPDDVELISETIQLTTAPTGSSAIFKVLKNGTDVYSSDPTVSASGFLASAGTLSGSTTFTARTDYLQIQCTQIGSTVAGADLAVILKMKLV